MFEFYEFGQKLYDLRKKRNMTQSDFAGRLGVTAQAVSKWENNQSYPDITLIPTIATILKVEIGYLFGQKNTIQTNVVFPKIYEEMPLIYNYKGTACYSTKTLSTTNGSGIKFIDGSTVELSTRLVMNIGKGEIKLLVNDDYSNDFNSLITSKNFDFDYLESLNLNLLSCTCDIIPSTDNKCHVFAKGDSHFMKMLNVNSQVDTLSINIDNSDENNGFYGLTQKNSIRIEFPCETGKKIAAKINGNGQLKSEIKKFASGSFSINGSGVITVQDFDELHTKINGSGFIKGKDIEKAIVNINGSGNVKLDKVCNIEAFINGSGDFTVGLLDKANNVLLKINGSGDIDIIDGECQKFDVNISGSGDINATNVTARKANIVISSHGNVVLGRVIESSTEQIKSKGVITILNRGEIE